MSCYRNRFQPVPLLPLNSGVKSPLLVDLQTLPYHMPSVCIRFIVASVLPVGIDLNGHCGASCFAGRIPLSSRPRRESSVNSP